MSKRLILFGNGKNIQCVFKILQLQGIDVYGFCVDDEYYTEPTILDRTVYKYSQFVDHCLPDDFIMFSPMSPKNKCRIRKEIFERFKLLGYDFFTFIDSRARVDTKEIGENVYIAWQAGIHPDVVIKDNVYIGERVMLAHDTVINKHSYIGAGSIFGGGCIVGECVSVGLGVLVRTDVKIADNASLGMGISIHKDITEPKTYIFTPLEQKWYDQKHKSTEHS